MIFLTVGLRVVPCWSHPAQPEPTAFSLFHLFIFRSCRRRLYAGETALWMTNRPEDVRPASLSCPFGPCLGLPPCGVGRFYITTPHRLFTRVRRSYLLGGVAASASPLSAFLPSFRPVATNHTPMGSAFSLSTERVGVRPRKGFTHLNRQLCGFTLAALLFPCFRSFKQTRSHAGVVILQPRPKVLLLAREAALHAADAATQAVVGVEPLVIGALWARLLPLVVAKVLAK